MLQRPGCLTPIAFGFVVGCLLVACGLAAESARAVRAGAGFLVASVALLGVGLWLRQRGWWD
jgi:hypothetical protein